MMNKQVHKPSHPDHVERKRALDPRRSILVQAPAGSGKTDLLTRRFLRLLAQVDEPGQVVAITFTNAAAAEMRYRILNELEKASTAPSPDYDDFSMASLAHRALSHSQALGWNLLDLPSQLRIRTIDSFCRELALQQPLLSGLGGGIDISEQPEELYRRAARETLRKVDQTGSALGEAIENLLLWRDNGWQELEDLLVEMLQNRDRWMHGFVLESEQDWEKLRERLERPFADAVRSALITLSQLLDHVPSARNEALELARFACEQCGGELHKKLAELAEIPTAPFIGDVSLEDARLAYANLASLLLTGDGNFRKQVNKLLGFPADRKREKGRILELISSLGAVPGLEAAFAAVHTLPSVYYTDEEWTIVRSCFTLLRQAAGELQIAFAEAGAADFIEVAQIAQRVLKGDDDLPTDAALAVSDSIRHLLVDEFQDTSRRQHQLLSSLIAAWSDRIGRTCFVVGDPMQSIYSFRDADAELFPRVRTVGLEIPHDQPLLFDSVSLTANFRTIPPLVEKLNRAFAQIFAVDDGSGVTFASAQPAREEAASAGPHFELHLDFVPQASWGKSADPEVASKVETARSAQIGEIVALIGSRRSRIEKARTSGEKFRIAILGRTKNHLVLIAKALREAKIPFRAVELERLAARPEVLDALALVRTLLNPQDRVAWLGVLRAPWCGLSLDDLHLIAGSETLEPRPLPLPELIVERLKLLSEEGRTAASRVLQAIGAAPTLRSNQPTASLGTWLEQVWLSLGGAACVNPTAQANLNLLWSCLDRLPNGGSDLLGPGLNAALEKLTALPDPEANSDCGVQLMTIHKSKGLEFEVVIVPELQAGTWRGNRKMLSWLERGLSQPGDSGEITEFLIAPFQRKGTDRSRAKQWVDSVYSEREKQETRRILYVASTRAREELHFFARPSYKTRNGEFTLTEPSDGLLRTAWLGFEEEIRASFEAWKANRPAAQDNVGQQVDSIAASGESTLLVMPYPAKPTMLRRLPPDYRPAISESPLQAVSELSVTGMGSSPAQLFPRHEGGLLSRALGTAVHSFLEELARQRITLGWESVRASVRQIKPIISARVQAAGIGQVQAAQIASEALQIALNASHDPIGAWILSPHTSAASEVSWAGVVSGLLRTVRVDRVFQAGSTPGAEGEECWWIIDYKTAHAGNLDPAQALQEFRKLFSPQVLAYAGLLPNMQGKDASGCSIRVGLYYPLMSQLDWWKI
jgi:ATP-dependent exoDNAse (exonuclease V) beta subunit